MKLEDLDQLVGKSVCTERPRTPAEVAAYGEGTEGGCGVVVDVSVITQTIEQNSGPHNGNVVSSITGRMVEFDWGMAWLVTEDTVLTPWNGITREDIDAL